MFLKWKRLCTTRSAQVTKIHSMRSNEMNLNEPFSNGLFLPIAWCVCVYLWLGRSLSNISKSLFLILMCLLFNLSSPRFVFIVRFTNTGAFIISILIKQKAPSKFQYYLNHHCHSDRIHFMQLQLFYYALGENYETHAHVTSKDLNQRMNSIINTFLRRKLLMKEENIWILRVQSMKKSYFYKMSSYKRQKVHCKNIFQKWAINTIMSIFCRI